MPASIWLRPTIPKAAELQRIIDRLSEAYGTVTFRPHLTVCGIPGDLGVLDAASAYVKECGLLPLKVAKMAVTGAVITPFRAVFIEVENTPALQEFRERLCGITGGGPLIPPHISLFYTLDRESQAPRTDFDAARLAFSADEAVVGLPCAALSVPQPAPPSVPNTWNSHSEYP